MQENSPLEPPKQNTSKQTWTIVLGCLVFILGLSSVILFFQNRLLKQQLADSLAIPSPSPTTSADPTADWKTYSGKEFSFKYPNYLFTASNPKLENTIDFMRTSEEAQNAIDCFKNNKGTIEKPCFSNMVIEISLTKNPKTPYSDLTPTSFTDDQQRTWQIWEVGAYDGDSGAQIKVDSTTWQILIREPHATDLYKQILSTFKFTEAASEKPTLTSPMSNSVVTNPLTVSGTAPAGWMVEGQLALKILDSQRHLIVQGVGREKVPGSWQSGKPADFTGSLTFTTSDTTGFLVIEADNPSGLPENAKSYEIAVKFK